jgi:hypothetical protein
MQDPQTNKETFDFEGINTHHPVVTETPAFAVDQGEFDKAANLPQVVKEIAVLAIESTYNVPVSIGEAA